MKIAVCQIGARHRYAIPRMLESGGVLSSFFCDANCVHPLMRLAGKFLSGCENRRCEGVPRGKIHSTLVPNLFLFRRRWHSRQMSSQDFILQGERFSRWIEQHWDKEADTLFTFSRTNSDLAERLKSRGVRNVVDMIISPVTERILGREYQENSTWHFRRNPYPPEQVEWEEGMWRKTIRTADLLLCPSQWVADGVVTLDPSAVPKIRLVPYGCSIDYGDRHNTPVPGKVIFCGNDPLRKGLTYLAEAAGILKKRNPRIQIEVIGMLSAEFQNDPQYADLKFRGKLTRAEIIREYLSADVFVLPSLSEGFAGVVAEAVCAGLPCVVTRECGSGIADGCDGLVVPSRSAAALADALNRLVEDRPLRNRLAAACLAQRGYFSADAWQNRLLDALKGING